MTRWWPIVLLLALPAPENASASSGVQPENRVRGFDLVAPTLVGLRVAPSPETHEKNSVAYGEMASGYSLAAEGIGSNAADAPRLAMQLAQQEAESAFTATGELSPEAIQGATRIFAPGELGTPAIPQGFGKYTTETFQSPSGPFQVHFYMNAETSETFYGLDYKTIFNGNAGPTYFQPFTGSAP